VREHLCVVEEEKDSLRNLRRERERVGQGGPFGLKTG
jgi:hypothetical protein